MPTSDQRIHYVFGDIFVRTPSPQSLRAWAPFWDTVSILFEFQNTDIDDDHPEWRIRWVAGVALLRTIGHVLAKVDGAISKNHRRMIDDLWNEWKLKSEANAILWHFIERERNNLLKTYTFGASTTEPNVDFALIYESGEDALELYREAVYWWRYQLETLEERLLRSTEPLPTNS